MSIQAFWSEPWTGALVNHLWQSTVVVAIAWLLAQALKKNHAKARYWLWMVASLKFLVPFSLLTEAGERMRVLIAAPIAKPALADAMEQFAQPFEQAWIYSSSSAPPAAHRSDALPAVLITLWACGMLAVVIGWARGWLQIRAIVQAASPLALAAEVPVLSSSSLLEPGVFGILRPVLLMPDGIVVRLTTEQLSAIVAHEMCHVRRRDNLTYALHMIVEALFWFYPPVWWIGALLLQERERACDEGVLETGNQPEVYAEGILQVCKSYVESPVAFVAGVTGSDLKQRIVRIMTEHVARKLDSSRKLLLGASGLLAVTVPLSLGLMHTGQVRAQAQSQPAPAGAPPSFEVATVRPSRAEAVGTNYHLSTSRFQAENAPLTALIRFAYDIKSDDQLPRDPNWIASERFDVDAKVDDAQTEAMTKMLPDQKFLQFRLMLRSLLEDRFKLKVSTQIKELPVYALVVAKGGPKLTPLNLPPETAARRMPTIAGGSRGELKAGACSMSMFTRWLSGTEDTGNRVVIDATGLNGVYDFTLSWTPERLRAVEANAGQGSADDSVGDTTKPSIFTALQEQLGLKLESRKAPVEVLVIDHVEQPSPN